MGKVTIEIKKPDGFPKCKYCNKDYEWNNLPGHKECVGGAWTQFIADAIRQGKEPNPGSMIKEVFE